MRHRRRLINGLPRQRVRRLVHLEIAAVVHVIIVAVVLVEVSLEDV